MDRAKRIIKATYPDFKLTAIVDDGDRFIFQIQPKNNEVFFGGVKAINKKTNKITEVNPLRIKGLVDRLMTEGVNNV